MIKTLNSESMEKYLMDYDVVNHKYFYWCDDIEARDISGKSEISFIKGKIWKTWYGETRNIKWGTEHAISTFMTLEKVYGDEDIDCRLVQCAIEKFLRDYVNIPGVDKLFDSKYFSFEWGMHLEYKEKQKDYSYYRDHYVHQIRNLYEMLVFLDDFGLEANCRDLYARTKNKMGNYIRNSIQREIAGNAQEEKELIGEIYGEYVKYRTEAREKNQTIKVDYGNEIEFISDLYFREIIYSAAILAALIHDIGYPITYMARVADGLQNFIPITRDFIDNRMNISHLHAELEQSVLFNIVPYEMIEKKLESSDHGAISAVIFLKYFYNKGYIREMKPVKKMVIELAAVVIFFHTLKYKVHGEKSWEFDRPIFYKDPLSFLFRICDDIQEWDREYFEISKARNYFICDHCRTMLHFNRKDKVYTCCCGRSVGRNVTQFAYRRVLQVKTSDYIKVERRTVNDKGFTIHIVYDLFKLLLVSHYNPTFGQIRAKDIKKLKQELLNQRYFPTTYVKCLVTSNPILLKEKILENFLVGNISAKLFDNFVNAEEEEGKDKDKDKEKDKAVEHKKQTEADMGCEQWADHISKIILNSANKKVRDKLKTKTKKVIRRNHSADGISMDGKSAAGKVGRKLIVDKLEFYLIILEIADIMRKGRKFFQNDILKVRAILSVLWKSSIFSKWDMGSDSLRYLCEDYLWQMIHEPDIDDYCEDCFNESYLNRYVQSDFLIAEVASYTDYDRYGKMQEAYRNNEFEKRKIPVDFYTDLYMFYKLSLVCFKQV